MKHSSNYAFIIVAAGTSSRLGRPKQMVKMPDGQTLLEHTLNAGKLIHGLDVFVVLGAQADAIKTIIADRDIKIIEHTDYANGMGSSIAAGIRALSPIYDAAIVSVCDQPFLNDGILKDLIQTFEKSEHDIIISEYRDGNGPPSLFASKYFHELSSLTGDDGAKAIVRKYKSSVGKILFPKGNIDIDEPSDMEKLSNGTY